MPNFSIVDKVSRVNLNDASALKGTADIRESLSNEDLATVELQNGSSFVVNQADNQSTIWLNLLNEFSETEESVYLEVEPETNIVQRLLLPKLYMVSGIEENSDDERQYVELEISHARHFISLSNPNYERLLNNLEEALEQNQPVLITEKLDEPEIIDVSPNPNPTNGVGQALFNLETTPGERVSEILCN